MKNFIGFSTLTLLVIGLWTISILVIIKLYGFPSSASEAGEMFGGINALFSGLALAGVIFTIRLQSSDVKTNQDNLNKSIEANQKSMEIMALSALIQEADCALARYERWETSEKSGDYTNAKAAVRQKLNEHRNKLEQTLIEIGDNQ